MAAVIRFPAKPRSLAAQVFLLPSAQTAAEETAGCVANPTHPLVTLTWAVAAVVIAIGLGPWVSRAMGIVLPTYALVRIGRSDGGL